VCVFFFWLIFNPHGNLLFSFLLKVVGKLSGVKSWWGYGRELFLVTSVDTAVLPNNELILQENQIY
jgi:hypothetical protein